MSDVIEDKIVRLNFQGNAFVQGISKATAALSNFTEKLQTGNFASKFEELNAVSLDKICTSIANLEYRFTLLGSVATNITARIANEVVNIAKGIEQATIGQIKSGGWSRAMNIANAKFQIEGLGYAWEKVEKAVSYGVKDTAYGLDAAASAASQLAASGVDFQKVVKTVDGQGLTQMHRSLRAISGVAAMTNSSYEEISHIFTTIAGNGKVMTEQLRMLSSRGLNAAAILAKAFGTTEAAVYEMVSKGEVDFQKFSDAMDDAFGQHAKDANKTFQGSLSNMKAALSRIGAIFATPVIDKTNVFFNSLTKQIDAFKAKLSDFKDEKGNPVAGFATHFAEAWERGVNALSKVVEILDISWFDKIASAADNAAVQVRDFFTLFQDKFFPEEKKDEGKKAEKVANQAAKAAKKQIETTKQRVKRLSEERKAAAEARDEIYKLYNLPQAAKDQMQKAGIEAYLHETINLTKKQTEEYKKLPQAAKDAMQKANIELYKDEDVLPQAAKDVMKKAGAFDYDEQTRDNLTFAERMMEYFSDGLVIMQQFSSFVKSVVSFVKQAAIPVMDAFEDMLSESEFGLVLTRIAGGLKKVGDAMVIPEEGLTVIYQVAYRVFKFVDSVAVSIAKTAEYCVRFVRKLIDIGVFGDILSIMRSVKEIAFEIVKPIKNAVKAIFGFDEGLEKPARTIKNITGLFADMFQNLANNKGTIASVVDWFTGGIAKIILNVKALFQNLKTLGVFRDIAYIGLKLLDEASKVIKPIVMAFKDAFHIGEGATGLAINIKKITATVADMISNFTVSGEAMEKLYNFFHNVFDGVKIVGNLIWSVLTFAVNTLTTIWNSGIIQSLYEKVKGFLGGITSFLSGTSEELSKVGENAKKKNGNFFFDFIADLFNGVANVAKGVDIGSILKLIVSMKLITALFSIFLGLGKIGTWAKTIGQSAERIQWILGNINSMFRGISNMIVYTTLPKIIKLLSEAFLYFSIAAVLLSQLDDRAFEKSMLVLIGFVGMVTIMCKVLFKSLMTLVVEVGTYATVVPMLGAKVVGMFIGLGAMIIMLGYGMALIASAITMIASVANGDNIGVAAATVVILLVTITAMAAVIVKTCIENPISSMWSIGTFVKMMAVLLAISGAAILAAIAIRIIADSLADGPDHTLVAGLVVAAMLGVIFVIMRMIMSKLVALTALNVGMISQVTVFAILLGAAALLVAIGLAAAEMAGAMKLISTIDPSVLGASEGALLAIGGILIVILGVAVLLAAFVARTSGGVMTWERAAVVVGVIFMMKMLISTIGLTFAEIAGAMLLLKNFSPDQFTDVILPMIITFGIIIVVVMGVAALLGSFSTATFWTLWGMTGLIGKVCSGIATVMTSVAALSRVNAEQATAAIMIIISLGLIIIALMACASMVPSNVPLLTFSLSVLIIASTLAIATAALLFIASFCKDVEWKAVLEVMAMVAALAIAIAIIANNTVVVGKPIGILTMCVALIALSAALVIIAAAFRIMGDPSNMVKKAIILGAFFVAIVAAVWFVGKQARRLRNISGAISALGVLFVEVGLAMIAFAYALKILAESDVSWKGVAMLGVIAGIVLLMAFIAGIQQVAEGIMTLSGAFLTIGLGLLAAGAAIWLVSKALDALGPALTKLIAPLGAFFVLLEEHKGAAIAIFVGMLILIVAITIAILKLAPAITEIAKAIKEAIVGVAKAIGNGVTKFNSWFTGLTTRSQIIIASLIGSICAALIFCSDDILDTIGELIIKFFYYLGTIVGDIAGALVLFVVKVIDALAVAIGDNSHKIVAALENVLTALLLLVFSLLEDLTVAMFNENNPLRVELISFWQEADNGLRDKMKERSKKQRSKTKAIEKPILTQAPRDVIETTADGLRSMSQE